MSRFCAVVIMGLLAAALGDYPEVTGTGLIQKGANTEKAPLQQDPEAYAADEPTYDGDDAIAANKEEIASEGETEEEKPDGWHTLSGYISSVLLPKAATTTQMLQTDIDNAAEKVRRCALLMSAAQPQKEAAEANLNRQQRKLAMCLRVKNGEVIKEEEFCEEWHSAAKNFNPKTLDNAKGNLKTYEHILKTYYDFYPKFMEEEAKCREMIGIMHSQDKHCSFRVGEITKVYCALKENRTKLCKAYDGCYAGAHGDYNWTITKATKLEEHTKKTWKALKCFQKASDSLKFARSIDHPVEQDGAPAEKKSIKCDPSLYSADDYSLKYPPVPEKETCIQEIVATGKYPSWCSYEPATTGTTTLPLASQGPSGGPGDGGAAYSSLLQEDATSFSKVEEYLADAASVLKKVHME